MPAELPLLCDHDGCQKPAVGKYVISAGKPGKGFVTVIRCKEHAGAAEPKELVNQPKVPA